MSDIMTTLELERHMAAMNGPHDEHRECARRVARHDAAQRARIEVLERVANAALRFQRAHASTIMRLQDAEHAGEYRTAARELAAELISAGLDKEPANGR